MQRYFIPKANWSNEFIDITDDDAHHINRVMRFKQGDKIICAHPDGKAAICQIIYLEKNKVKVEIKEWLDTNSELPVHVAIAQGLTKGNKLELIFQKGTELGAQKFCLFEADRSIVKWDKKKSEQKLKRYRKIIKEASEQCHRNQSPILEEPNSLLEIVEKSTNYDVKLFAYEEEAKVDNYSSFGAVLSQVKENEKLLIFIGPEGGFSIEEAMFLKDNNFVPIRLGKRILRTETASLYALASISYHFEELRCH
ncbi:16S rRNA (uracil(1498)-N(3))-methyltransferase [Pseudogracilibacillus sp. SO30301A]|uniref:16S rRNA (uracil(1498)-N(3))-methyltransferase n=1 Tax=Pseudogracilibacillus sp. SO30301A TaxID=3098291 RepID=UPI00300DDC84